MQWTNEKAAAQWETVPTEIAEAMAEDGDFAKRHLANPHLLRLIGDVAGRRVLDAGCGNGYLARMLAARGAEVTGLEPARVLLDVARRKETELGQGVTYVHGRLEPGAPTGFDVVVCSMVLMSIPDWRPAMRACVEALVPGGLFVFALTHPAFEDLGRTWRAHGEYRTGRYLADYDMPSTYATDFHRPLSAYLNEAAALGCRLREIAEPGLDPALAEGEPGLEGFVRLPNFLIAAFEGPA